MEALLVILFVVVVAAAMMPKPNGAVDPKQEILQALGKTCPPHKWEYVEIKDHEGETHAWKVVCKVCGPLKPIDGR